MKQKKRFLRPVLMSAVGNAETAAAVSHLETSSGGRYPYEEKEIWCENDGQKIYGKAYIPNTNKGKMPLVIFSHELCATHASGDRYAKELASRGIAVYTFDYRGGSAGSKSDGKTTDMSVLTEVSDLEKVLAAAKQWGFVDAGKIVLLGGSQGGLVASLAAARHADELKGMILLYAAFVIHDELHKHFQSLSEVPQEFLYNGWIRVSRRYAMDAWNLDAYGPMKKFSHPVLLLHGDEDKDVPLYYSLEAQKSYPNAQLHIINGTGHMFPEQKSFAEARDEIIAYLQQIHIMPKLKPEA